MILNVFTWTYLGAFTEYQPESKHTLYIYDWEGKGYLRIKLL